MPRDRSRALGRRHRQRPSMEALESRTLLANSVQLSANLGAAPKFHQADTAVFTVTNYGTAGDVGLRFQLNDQWRGIVTAVEVSQGTAPSASVFFAYAQPTVDLGVVASGASATITLVLTAASYAPKTLIASLGDTGVSATLVVGEGLTNANDSGPGSLRQLILDADADPTPGVEAILPEYLNEQTYNPFPTINLQSPLPAITRPISFDDTTGYSSYPVLTLDGTNAGSGASGLTFGPGSDGSTLRGVTIDHFSGDGIDVTDASGLTIQFNAIGVDHTSTFDEGNGGDGIKLEGSSNDTIGGLNYDPDGDTDEVLATVGNVISANGGYGIETVADGNAGDIKPSSSTLIQGNLIGTDGSGTHALGNIKGGILIGGGEGGDTIGGTSPAIGNVIASNGGDGILGTVRNFPDGESGVEEGVGGELIEGNFFGSDRTGNYPLGNSGDGVDLVADPYNPPTSNTIGGSAPGAVNLFGPDTGDAIAFNPVDDVSGNRYLPGVPAAFVGIAVSGSDAETQVGSPFRLTYTVANHGPSTATGLSLAFLDNSPGLEAASGAINPDSSTGNGTIPFTRATIPDLASGASETFVLDFKASTPGEGSGTIKVALAGMNPTETNTAYDQSTVPVVATLAPRLQVKASVGSAPAFHKTQTATFTVTNAGNLAEPDATLSLETTAELYASLGWQPIVMSDSVSQGTPAPVAEFLGLNQPVVDFGRLAPGASATVTLVIGASFAFSPTNIRGTAHSATGAHGPGDQAGVEVGAGLVNTNDSGPGSLRQAILDADADTTPGVETILFDFINITDGSTIHLLSPLPAITRPVDLDFSTTIGPAFTLDGSKAGAGAVGLTLDVGTAKQVGAGGSVVRGLAIDHFSGDGIDITDASGVTYGATPLGLTIQADDLEGNGGDGIKLVGSGRDTIGGTLAGSGNVISGNAGYGIETESDEPVVDNASGQALGTDLELESSSSTLIQGNLIGTDAAGTHAMGNAKGGILVGGGSGNDTIGGTLAGSGNVISGNGGAGFIGSTRPANVGDVSGTLSVSNELFQGNAIGTDRSGTLSLGNAGDGIGLGGGTGFTVGGLAAGEGNTFGPNVGPAVAFDPGNTISGNTFLPGVPNSFVGISVAGSDANTRVGGPIDLTYTVANHGPSTATGIRLMLDQSGGNFLTIISGPLTPDPSTKTFYVPFTQATLPDLAPGASESFTLGFQATTPGDGAGTIGVSLAGLVPTESNSAYERVSSPIEATEVTDLQVSAKLDTVPAFHSAQSATFTVTNAGNVAEPDAKLALMGLDNGLLTAVDVSQGTAPGLSAFTTNAEPEADLGVLAPGDSATVTVVLAAVSYAPFSIDATAYSATGETSPGRDASVLVGEGVTNTNDSGPGSLRQAILDADADPTTGVEPILFGPFSATDGTPTIALQSPLPAITRTISLDASSIFGFPDGPVFTLDGSKAGAGAVGLTFGPGSSGSTVRGLDVTGFGGDGIDLTATYGVTIQDDAIVGNGGYGIALDPSGLDMGNTIGGADGPGGNVIAFNVAGDAYVPRPANLFVGNTFGIGVLAADLGLSVTRTDPPAAVGDPIRLVYTLTNAGSDDATNIRLAFSSFPAGTVLESGGPLTADPDSPGAFDLASLASGGSAIFAVDLLATPAVVPPLKDFSLTVEGLDQVDPNLADDSVAVSSAAQIPNPDQPTQGFTSTDLAVTAMPILGPVKVGVATTLTFLVTNAGLGIATSASFAVDLAGLFGSTLVGIMPSQGGLLPSTGRPGVFYADLGEIVPGQSVAVTVTFIPDRPGVFGASAASSADAVYDPDPSNNLAFATVAAGMFQVNDVSSLPSGDRVGSILLSFGDDLVPSKAKDLRNYRLTIPASAGHKAEALRIASATYDRARRQVLLKLATPLPALGTPIHLVVAGLTAVDGSVLADGQFSATVTIPAPRSEKPEAART